MIPTEHEGTVAVDAAARAWFDRQQSQRRDAGRLRPDGRPWQFDDLPHIDQQAVRELVLAPVWAALNALPDRRADLAAGVDALADEWTPNIGQGSGHYLNPGVVVARLRALRGDA